MKVLRKAFDKQLDPLVSDFVNCVKDDTALIEVDIQGSLAHAEMLAAVGLITSAQATKIKAGLTQLQQEFSSGQRQLDPACEDVHMNVETALQSLIGEDALYLHTARSRNDQVALDMRLYTQSKTNDLMLYIQALQKALLSVAQQNSSVVMPGYTHLQRAQPVLFAHALHAFVEMLSRDIGRYDDSLKRTMVSPLGAGALAGTALPINPTISAKALGLDSVFANSLDAVSDRDFVVEFLATSALTAIHLSQLAETLIIWCTSEFSFIEFEDNVTTASSLMPNKKNPDPVELIRGKAGAVIGDLVNVLVTLKSLPLGYNRDLQETKSALINTANTLESSLKVMTVAVSSMKVHANHTLQAASDSFLFATDIAEYLVRQGIPFRESHHIVSSLVQLAHQLKCSLDELSLKDFKQASKEFQEDVFDLFNPLASITAKSSIGSTNPNLVTKAMLVSQEQLPNP